MPEVIGRYVTIFIPGDKKILTLCEVEVYGISVLGMSLENSFPTFNFIVCPNDANLSACNGQAFVHLFITFNVRISVMVV